MTWGYPGEDRLEERRGDGKPRKPRAAKPMGEIVATYDYLRHDGSLAFQVARDNKKDFYPRRPNKIRDPGEPAWLYGMGDEERILYRLPEITVAIYHGHRIYVCEGEKDADTLAGLGVIATTNPGGVGMGWTDVHTKLLEGAKDVVILPDNDRPGRLHARKVARALRGKVEHVRIVHLQGLPEKGDVSDWIATGKTLADLERAVEEGGPSGWVNAAQLLETPMPPVEWIVPNVMSVPSLTILSGESGVWKSWIGTQLCIATSTHESWFGAFPVDAERAMLVTADEDAGEARRKIQFLTNGYRMNGTHRELLRRNFLLWIGPLDFDDDDQFGNLEDAVADFRPDIIIIDHVRVCFSGSENDSEFARNVKSRTMGMHGAHPCCVMWFHHWNKPSKDGGKRPGDRLRGTGALRGIADHHIAVQRSEMGVGSLIVDKNRKGREPAPFDFVPNIDEEHETAVMNASGNVADILRGRTGAERAITDALRAHGTPMTYKQLEVALPQFKIRTIRRTVRELETSRVVAATTAGPGRPVVVGLLENNPILADHLDRIAAGETINDIGEMDGDSDV